MNDCWHAWRKTSAGWPATRTRRNVFARCGRLKNLRKATPQNRRKHGSRSIAAGKQLRSWRNCRTDHVAKWNLTRGERPKRCRRNIEGWAGIGDRRLSLKQARPCGKLEIRSRARSRSRRRRRCKRRGPLNGDGGTGEALRAMKSEKGPTRSLKLASHDTTARRTKQHSSGETFERRNAAADESWKRRERKTHKRSEKPRPRVAGATEHLRVTG